MEIPSYNPDTGETTMQEIELDPEGKEEGE